MSKDRIPEVGDVYKDLETDRVYHITLVENDIVWFALITKYSGIQVFWQIWNNFRKDCKYLGKSKANINDLFKTENEE